MLMEENIDDKSFYDYPDNAALLLEAQQQLLEDILSDPSSNATSDDDDRIRATCALPEFAHATAPPAPKLKPAPTPHEAHPTPLPHPESAPASVLHAPESPPAPELKPAPTPHEAHPTPPPHPESALPPVPTTKPEPRLSKLEELMGYGSKPDRLTLQHLKDITKNFSNERILGRGGFGVVYKGVLPSGEVVAVKKLFQARRISQKQYENEINLMKLHHRNIVRLVGYCYETQRLLTPREGKFVIAWNTESLLCLEYLPNGSLHNCISDALSGFDWRVRWKIIEGICFGLTYLHEQSNGPIIHMNLKPANILLDENMVPKIADFGLSRLLYKKNTISTATTSGTIGYMPPEYLQGIITPKSDIFSLGVIIMEVITGHRGYPLDITTSSVDFIELELQNWRNRLQGGPDNASLEMCCQQIKRCIQIGLICANPEWTKRPTMKQIINMLHGLESMNLYITNERSSSKVEAGWIELVIIEARDLIAADLRGTSDPYVRVHYGNNKKRTKVIIKTLNPQWNETFEFAETGEPLVLHVKDHNAVLPTASIGNCTVEYNMLSLNEPADKWIPLQGVRSGEIHVKIVRSLVDSKKKVA